MAENQNPAGSGGELPPPPEPKETGRGGRSQNLARFTIELGDDRSSGRITVDTLKKRLRGRYSPKMGAGVIMNKMPVIPGMRMRVNCRESTVTIFDPLEREPELLKKINSVSEQATAISGGGRFTFVPSVEMPLNPDLLKTLLIECRKILEDGRGDLVDGDVPSQRQIDEMPGRELFDPWNSGRKPKYKDQAEAYYERLEQQSV